ncbi:unnamed protein product [Peniophora sp. CBMAI 1063]|nr:unnamed protein product [Peniophora sp. CBMAI 1063]
MLSRPRYRYGLGQLAALKTLGEILPPTSSLLSSMRSMTIVSCQYQHSLCTQNLFGHADHEYIRLRIARPPNEEGRGDSVDVVDERVHTLMHTTRKKPQATLL